MFLRTLTAALFAAFALTQSALAGSTVEVQDGYARSSNPKSGAAFLQIHNLGAEDDRLIEVRSPVAQRVELHTHVEDANGVMSMREIEEGLALPASGMIEMRRGGDHIMFMGLTEPFGQGDLIPVTLVFEKAGEIEHQIEVDQSRKDTAAHSHD